MSQVKLEAELQKFVVEDKDGTLGVGLKIKAKVLPGDIADLARFIGHAVTITIQPLQSSFTVSDGKDGKPEFKPEKRDKDIPDAFKDAFGGDE